MRLNWITSSFFFPWDEYKPVDNILYVWYGDLFRNIRFYVLNYWRRGDHRAFSFKPFFFCHKQVNKRKPVSKLFKNTIYLQTFKMFHPLKKILHKFLFIITEWAFRNCKFAQAGTELSDLKISINRVLSGLKTSPNDTSWQNHLTMPKYNVYNL